MNTDKNIIFCGVGGQGTVLASRLIAAAAMNKGIPVKTAETIGMAQRGGSVTSFLRLGESANAPLIGLGQADLIVAFEPAEAVRMLPYLKKDGAIVTSSKPIKPVSASIGQSVYDLDAMMDYLKQETDQLEIVDADAAAQALGSSKCLNVVLLGAAIKSGKLGMTKDELMDAIKQLVPAKFHELNLNALNYVNQGE